jgi:catechol 2,3-dioxygenase-like lactoylglutathione lyase family enzyme
MPLSMASLFVKDLERAATFYHDAFGLEEVVELRSDIFRALVLAEGCLLALHADPAYRLVGLEEAAGSVGIRSMLTFDPGSAAAVDSGVATVVAAGATLVKGPFVTVYNARQAVFLDPDGHAVRLSHQL